MAGIPKRIEKETEKLAQEPPPGFDARPDADNYRYFHITMTGTHRVRRGCLLRACRSSLAEVTVRAANLSGGHPAHIGTETDQLGTVLAQGPRTPLLR